MKLKKIFSIILITCLCMLSISSIAFSASAGIESELILLKKTLALINERVTDLETVVTEQTTLIEEVQEELNLLKTVASDIEAEIDALNGTLGEIDATSIKEVKEKIEKLDENVKSFEKSLNDKIAALEAKDKELSDKDTALEAKDKELSDKDAALEAKIKELEDKITALENKINESETEKAVENPTEKSEENEASNTNAGCEASVAISAIATVCAIGVATFIKKKD